VSLTQLGYEHRPDGNFLIRCKCRHCGEQFDVHACANAATKQGMYGLCDACEAVRKYESGEVVDAQ